MQFHDSGENKGEAKGKRRLETRVRPQGTSAVIQKSVFHQISEATGRRGRARGGERGVEGLYQEFQVCSPVYIGT